MTSDIKLDGDTLIVEGRLMQVLCELSVKSSASFSGATVDELSVDSRAYFSREVVVGNHGRHNTCSNNSSHSFSWQWRLGGRERGESIT